MKWWANEKCLTTLGRSTLSGAETFFFHGLAERVPLLFNFADLSTDQKRQLTAVCACGLTQPLPVKSLTVTRAVMYLRFFFGFSDIEPVWFFFFFCEKKLCRFSGATRRRFRSSRGNAGPQHAAGRHERGTRDRTAAVLARPIDPEHRRYSQRTSFLRDKCAYKRSTRYARGEITYTYASLFRPSSPRSPPSSDHWRLIEFLNKICVRAGGDRLWVYSIFFSRPPNVSPGSWRPRARTPAAATTQPTCTSSDVRR